MRPLHFRTPLSFLTFASTSVNQLSHWDHAFVWPIASPSTMYNLLFICGEIILDLIQTLYRPYTDPIQTLYRPYTDPIQTLYTGTEALHLYVVSRTSTLEEREPTDERRSLIVHIEEQYTRVHVSFVIHPMHSVCCLCICICTMYV
jgi:hypothetical protein